MSDRLRVVELFCGIGGCAAALGDQAEIVAAIDINENALQVYRHNYPHPAAALEIGSLSADWYRELRADLWWLSPPCQPYTKRGLKRDLDDPRAASLAAVLEKMAVVRPPYVALENVPDFRGTLAHRRLRDILTAGGYSMQERILCPTQLGLPNRRRRFYLVASRWRLNPWPAERWETPIESVHQFLDRDISPDLWVEPEWVDRYNGAMHFVDPYDAEAVTNCFTSAYGRSYVRSGSYLQVGERTRRFSPTEILRLLGFPPSFTLPPAMPPSRLWPLVGNSLSVPAVRKVLAAVPRDGARRN
jgi:DNA (cytosine-5)-methyltransferase 1